MSYHIETGSKDEGTRTRLTDYEVASRISYMTLSSPPDAALMAAAARAGELQTLGNIQTQVERLLNAKSAAARARVRSFFNYYAQLSEVADPNAAAAAANGLSASGLGAEMRAEALDFADDIFWNGSGDFKRLMTSTASFPRTERIRKILGAPALVAGDGKPVTAAADYSGLLHRPALLSYAGMRTSPILRGAHIRVNFLCQTMVPLDTATIEQVISDLGDIENQPNRDKVTQLTKGAACIGCHQDINHLGFAFENFDQTGMRRMNEVARSEAGSVIGTFPLNLRTDNGKIDMVPLTVADSQELTEKIAVSTRGPACFSQKAFEYFRARNHAAEADGCALSETEAVSRSAGLREVVVRAIANEDIFWKRK